MNELDRIYLMTKWKAEGMLEEFFFDEEGDVNILSMVILMAIAVLAAVAFRKQLKILIDNLFLSINNQQKELTSDF